jgi:predicted ABC-type ATPase
MPEGQRPVLVVVAGANGSGKTTLTNQLLKDRWLQGVTYLNPDQIAQDLFGGWNDPKAVLKAAKHVEREREAALASGDSIAFETVFSAPDKLAFVQHAKQREYFVRLFYVMTASPTINAARVAQRVMEGGHEVPIGKIVSRFTGSLANAAAAALIVDRFYAFDNSVEGQAARRVFRAADGVLAKEYEAPPHAVAKALRAAVASRPRRP